MQLPAKKFIDLLESQQLLSDEIVEELRRQLRESKTKLSSELLAKLLVDNGHLTKFQATKLISQVSGPVAEQTAPAEEEELGLAVEPAQQGLKNQSSSGGNVATVFIEDEDLVDDEDIVEVEAIDADVEEIQDVEPIELGEIGEAEEAEAVEVIPVGDMANAGLSSADLNPGGSSTPRRPVKKQVAKANPWDSFRILGVGLLLALCLIAGFFLVNHFRRGSADERIARADTNYEQRSYETAATMYKEFVESFPTHAKASYAKVRRALALLRKDAEGAPDPAIGLKTAQAVLPSVAGESGLNDQQSDLAGALVGLAQKFNDRADARKETDERRALMAEMDKLMELINNPQYVGATQRTQQAPSLLRIEEDRQRILREINRDDDLAAALVEIDQRLEDEDVMGAYEVRRKLVKRYPLLETHESLIERVNRATEIQKSHVGSSQITWSVSPSDESNEAAVRSFVLGNRKGKSIPAMAGRVVFVKVKGSVYGLDGETGEILWRKFVGRGFEADPLRLGEAAMADALVSQPEAGKLSRISGADGVAKWVASVSEPTLMPVLESEDLFVATYSGSVASLDSAGGQAKWTKQLPQPVDVAPGVARGSHLYIPGEHSNLYVLDRRDGRCLEVHYLGHRAGSIAVPPMLVLGQLFLFENITHDSARIRILATDDNGLQLKQAQNALQVDGNIVVAPQVDGRRLIVQSNLGQILALDIEPTVDTQKVTTIATVPKNFHQPQVSWTITGDNKIWAADNRITRFDVQVSGQKLSRAWIKDDGDTFTGPLQKFDNVIVHTRSLRGNQGVRATAIDADSGEPLWDIDLGVPVQLLSQSGEGSYDVVNSSGSYYALDTGRPLRSDADANPAQGKPSMRFAQPTWLSDSTAVLLNTSNTNQLAIFSDSGTKLRILTANFGAAKPSCPPVALGENLVVGLDNGQLVVVNPSNGTLASAPYQPAMEPGKKVRWNQPLVGADAQTLIVASDRLKLVRLGTGDSLRPLTEVDLQHPLTGPIVAVGDAIAAVQSTKVADTLKFFHSTELTETGALPLDSRLVAGPFPLAEGCVLQTNAQLMRISSAAEKLWSIPFPNSELIAPPVESEGNLVLATKAGQLFVIDASTGETLGSSDAGQAFSSAPFLLPQGLLIGSDEGAVLALQIPTSVEVP